MLITNAVVTCIAPHSVVFAKRGLITQRTVSSATLVDDADETLYYTIYVLWDLVDDEGTRRGR